MKVEKRKKNISPREPAAKSGSEASVRSAWDSPDSKRDHKEVDTGQNEAVAVDRTDGNANQNEARTAAAAPDVADMFLVEKSRRKGSPILSDVAREQTEEEEIKAPRKLESLDGSGGQ